MQRISRPRLSIIAVYPFEEEPDPNGDIALSHESNYHVEGMSYTDSEDRETRIQCFQAAEILYLHAAAKGNVIALNPTDRLGCNVNPPQARCEVVPPAIWVAPDPI